MTDAGDVIDKTRMTKIKGPNPLLVFDQGILIVIATRLSRLKSLSLLA